MSKMFLCYQTFVGRQGKIDLKDWHDGMSVDNVDAIAMGELSEEANRSIHHATLHIVHDDGSMHLRNYKRSGPTWMITGVDNLFSDRDVAKIWLSIIGAVILMFVGLWLAGVR
jgi:hypothetical protein